MLEQFKKVSNPLTIIAIFAGLAEVSGAIVLPFIEAENQRHFMYFLIGFPTILVLLFFLTLNLNHKVLYSPSDFANDETFVRVMNTTRKVGSNFEALVNRISDIQLELNALQLPDYGELDSENKISIEKLQPKIDKISEAIEETKLANEAIFSRNHFEALFNLNLDLATTSSAKTKILDSFDHKKQLFMPDFLLENNYSGSVVDRAFEELCQDGWIQEVSPDLYEYSGNK